jgi:hypothetical protein
LAVLEASLHFPDLPIAAYFDVKIRLCVSSVNYMSSKLVVSTSIYVDPTFSLLRTRIKDIFTSYLSKHFQTLDAFLRKAEKNINPSQDSLFDERQSLIQEHTDIVKAVTIQNTVQSTNSHVDLANRGRIKPDFQRKCNWMAIFILVLSLFILLAPFYFKTNRQNILEPFLLASSCSSSASVMHFLRRNHATMATCDDADPFLKLVDSSLRQKRKLLLHSFDLIHEQLFEAEKDVAFLLQQVSALQSRQARLVKAL